MLSVRYDTVEVLGGLLDTRTGEKLKRRLRLVLRILRRRRAADLL
jgi:hypothetical protein